MDTELNFKEAIKFLKVLFGGTYEGSVVIATLPKMSTIWIKSNETDKIKAFIESANAQQKNVYFNVALQDEEAARNEWTIKHEDKSFKYCRGSTNTVIGITVFWIDLDVKGTNHAETNLPKNFDEAMEIVKLLPLQPTIIVSTGGGFMFIGC